MKEFENKVIIVTGGASGIGKSICEEFNKANAKVVIISFLLTQFLIMKIT